MLLKIILIMTGLLFFMNWICLLASQKFHGFPWGDFLLIGVLSLLIFKNIDNLKSFSRIIPDTLDTLAMEPRESFQDVKQAVRETQTTAVTVLDYFKSLVKKDLENRMGYESP